MAHVGSGSGSTTGLLADVTRGTPFATNPAFNTAVATTGITVATTSNAGGQPHAIVQPTMVMSYILRVQ